MTDNKENLVCPACGEIMKKYFIKDANISIDICTNSCGGIYFDNKELEKVLRINLENEQELYKEIGNKKFNTVNTTQERICPVCGATMMKSGAANGAVEIDVCAFCGGKFLDANELQSIIDSEYGEFKDDKIKSIVQIIFEQNLDNVTVDVKAIPGYKERVNFFQNLAEKYVIYRG